MTDRLGRWVANVNGASPWEQWQSWAFDGTHYPAGDILWPAFPEIDIGSQPDWWPVREGIFTAVVLRND